MYTIEHFIMESNSIEDIRRMPTVDEIVASLSFLKLDTITVEDMEELVRVYEPTAKLRGEAGSNVTVGDFVPMAGGYRVVCALTELLQKDNNKTPFELHAEYETIHPFTDGNGRSGRMLWLWAMGGVEKAPLGFLHHWYYQSLQAYRS